MNELYEQTGTTVLGCYISEINNSIVLMIDEDTQEIIEKQRATISYSVPIEFEVSDVVECTSVEIKGGDMLYNMDCYRYTSVKTS